MFLEEVRMKNHETIWRIASISSQSLNFRSLPDCSLLDIKDLLAFFIDFSCVFHRCYRDSLPSHEPKMVLIVSDCRSPDAQDFRVLFCFHRCDRFNPSITYRPSCTSLNSCAVQCGQSPHLTARERSEAEFERAIRAQWVEWKKAAGDWRATDGHSLGGGSEGAPAPA